MASSSSAILWFASSSRFALSGASSICAWALDRSRSTRSICAVWSATIPSSSAIRPPAASRSPDAALFSPRASRLHPARAEARKTLSRRRDFVVRGERAKLLYRFWRLVAEGEHAETVAVQKLEVGRPASVRRKDATRRNRHGARSCHGTARRRVPTASPPRVEVVTSRLVGVVAVDVQEVDRRVGEVAVRFVESLAQERQKRAVASLVQLLRARSRPPRRNSPPARRLSTYRPRSSASRVPNAGPVRKRRRRTRRNGPQFDQQPRPALGDEPKGEGNVPPPRARLAQPFGDPKDRIEVLRRQPIKACLLHGPSLSVARESNFRM